jgi:hypothetical protein
MIVLRLKIPDRWYFLREELRQKEKKQKINYK